MGEFQKKKEGLTALVMKKKELEREVYRIQQYLAKFRMKLKEKEKVTMVEMVISSEEDEKADVWVSIVSNIIEYYPAFSIMPECIIYVIFITIFYFFLQGKDEKSSVGDDEKKAGGKKKERHETDGVHILCQTLSNLFYQTLSNLF